MIQGYPTTARIQVRWRDMDATGHVNNAVYFTYWEMARTAYLLKTFKVREPGVTTFAVATIRCDFLSQVTAIEELEVGIRLPRVGRSSFDFEYELRGQDGRRIATASSVQVLFDYRTQEKVPITDEWLEKIARVEGKIPGRKAARCSS